jgi:lipopolysaccharide transport system permease protein
MSTVTRDHHVIIRKNQAWMYLDWRGIVEYRDLLFVLVRRDFISRYKQTILGPAWFVLSPLITTVVYTLVFSSVLGVSTAGVPPSLFYLSGLLSWSYFSNLVGTAGTTFISNVNLFGKVYFPRMVVPFALVLSNMISFGIQLATFLAVLGWISAQGHFSIHAGGIAMALALTPLYLVHIAMLGLGVGLLLSALTAKYRDFQYLVPFVVNLWMYATPVIYPVSHIPKRFAWLVVINPMAPIVENMRSLFLGTPPMDQWLLALSIGESFLICVVGVLVFQRTARTFIDYI